MGNGSEGEAVAGGWVEGCAYHDRYEALRFGLIVGGAGSVALVGLIGNLQLAHRLSKAGRSQLYLGSLAFLDALICVSYIVLFCGDAIGLYLSLEWVYLAWLYATIPVFFVSKVAQLASVYVVIAASLQRLFTMNPKASASIRQRIRLTGADPRLVTAVIMLGAILLRFSVLLELKIDSFPDCPSNKSQEQVAIGVTGLKSKEWYHFFDFYFLFVVQVLAPFAALLVLNASIIISMRRRYQQQRRATERTQGVRRRSIRRSVRGGQRQLRKLVRSISSGTSLMASMRSQRRSLHSATYNFVLITASYLVCNSLSVLIQVLERLPGSPWLLVTEDAEGRPLAEPYPNQFYVLTTDLISFLFTLNSTLRFFINLAFNRGLRGDEGHRAKASRTPSPRRSLVAAEKLVG